MHVIAKEKPCGHDDVILEVDFLEDGVFITLVKLFYGKVSMREVMMQTGTWS